MTYKKRAKAGWNSDKDSSNKSERIYEKQEVNSELESAEIGESTTAEPEEKFVSSGKKTKKKTYKYPEEQEIARLEKKIRQAERWLERNADRGFGGEFWMSRINMREKTRIEKCKPKLQKLQEKLQQKKDSEK